MLNIGAKAKARRHVVRALNEAMAARARAPVFYAELGVADTIDGRFDLVALHAWMVLERLRETGLNDLSQGFIDALFLGFDEGLRDLGAGDMGMGRRMKKLGDAFFGRLKAYGECADAEALRGALERNLYRGEASAHAARIAAYVLSARDRVARCDLAAGVLDFGPLP